MLEFNTRIYHMCLSEEVICDVYWFSIREMLTVDWVEFNVPWHASGYMGQKQADSESEYCSIAIHATAHIATSVSLLHVISSCILDHFILHRERGCAIEWGKTCKQTAPRMTAFSKPLVHIRPIRYTLITSWGTPSTPTPSHTHTPRKVIVLWGWETS